ncbi:alpha/beta hydrolase [Bowmanella denitrificans]|uniref:Proline iminopeptidase n=1 Tax=Bowmanella denitrificans TaxID=366582 RepID=A0ABN0XU87_9ALTE
MKKWQISAPLGLILVALIFVLGMLCSVYQLVSAGKEINRNALWLNTNNGGIDESFYLQINGVRQYIRVRGRDLSNPLLLDLHGGPGGAFTPLSHRLLLPLTEYFTVVEWDQRGAGRSIADNQAASVTDYATMVEDAVAVMEHVTQRFGQSKLVLVGHSWGSMLGLGVVAKRPDLVSAYVGVGQALGWKSGFEGSRRQMMVLAEEQGDIDTFNALEALSQWPDADQGMAHIQAIQQYVPRFAGSIYALRDPTDDFRTHLTLDAVLSPDTSIGELLSFITNSEPSLATRQLIRDLYHYEIEYPQHYVFSVPMFIFQGERDLQTPTYLVKNWFEQVESPHKEYVAFQHSAHFVINEEPGKYLYSLLSKVRPMALQPVSGSQSMD